MGYDLTEVVSPKLVKVKQKFASPSPIDILHTIKQELARPEIHTRVQTAQKIAVAVGSRGIANIDIIVKEIVDKLKAMGAFPFIVPAMGSHGGATAEGQKKVLANLGVTESSMGVPIEADMDVLLLGQSPSGVPVYMSKSAYAADGIILVCRVKPHTSFRGTIESGIHKMLAIGLGKEKAANVIHSFGLERFDTMIPEIGKYVRENSRVLFAVTVLEDVRENTVKIVAVEPGEFESIEKQLLAEAKDLIGKLYFNNIDVLVVREIGKNISGEGMDPNVTGRFSSHLRATEPSIQKIVVLDLTPQTGGNGSGIGMADIITKRLLDKLDLMQMYINAITARVLTPVKIPLIAENDREAIGVALKSCWGVQADHERVVIIKNTLELEEVFISVSLLEEASHKPQVDIVGQPFDISFDADGFLQLML